MRPHFTKCHHSSVTEFAGRTRCLRVIQPECMLMILWVNCSSNVCNPNSYTSSEVPPKSVKLLPKPSKIFTFPHHGECPLLNHYLLTQSRMTSVICHIDRLMKYWNSSMVQIQMQKVASFALTIL